MGEHIGPVYVSMIPVASERTADCDARLARWNRISPASVDDSAASGSQWDRSGLMIPTIALGLASSVAEIRPIPLVPLARSTTCSSRSLEDLSMYSILDGIMFRANITDLS